MGRNGADEIKAHPFFAGVDWNTLRDIEAPFKPQLQSITDTSYFPTDELENVPDAPAVAAMMAQQQSNAAGLPEPQAGDSGLPFIGYTYKRLFVLFSSLLLNTNNLIAMRSQRRLECNLFDPSIHFFKPAIYKFTRFIPRFPILSCLALQMSTLLVSNLRIYHALPPDLYISVSSASVFNTVLHCIVSTYL